jgi:preprotein translocase subunit SecE
MSAEKVGEEKERGRRRRSAKQEEPVVEEVASEERGIAKTKGRATPSRRREEEQEEKSGNLLTRVRDYLEGVQSEIKKVVWPTREEARRLTIIVLVTLIVSSILLGGISAAFTELFRIGLGQPILLIGFMVVAVGIGLYVARSRRNTSP